MDIELLDRVIDVHGNAIWTGRFPLRCNEIMARDFTDVSDSDTDGRLSGHELLRINRFRSETPVEFCQALADRARERITRRFSDTPQVMRMMPQVGGIE